MKRRRQKNKAEEQTGPKTKFGLELTQQQQANDNLNKLEARMVDITLTRNFVPSDVVKWLFPQPVIDKMTAAHGFVNCSYDKVSYEIEPPHLGQFALLFSFDRFKMVAPASSCIQMLGGRSIDFGILIALAEVKGIVAKFNHLRELLTWFNNNATAGAIKYYFPAMAALIPEGDSAFHRADGIRYKEPQGISSHLSAIRDAAALIASAMLLPIPETEPEWFVKVAISKFNSQQFRLI